MFSNRYKNLFSDQFQNQIVLFQLKTLALMLIKEI